MLREYYNSELNIVETILKGGISMVDIQKHYSYLRTSKDLPKNLRVLIDARQAILSIKPDDIRSIEKAVNVTKLKYNSMREAIIVSRPYDYAMATLSEMLSKGNFFFKTFSTKEAAIHWLTQV